MERLLTIKDVTELCRISYATLYRWLKARTFPQPVNGRGRKLLWNPSDIERWAHYSESPPVQVATPPTPSESNRRHRAAMNDLRKMGIRVSQKESGHADL